MFIPRKFEKLHKFSFPYQLYNLGNKRENKLFLRDHLRKNGKIVTLRYLHERYRALLDRRTNIQNISTETGKNRKNTKKDLTNTLLFGSSCINSSSRKTTLHLHLSFLSRILVQMPTSPPNMQTLPGNFDFSSKQPFKCRTVRRWDFARQIRRRGSSSPDHVHEVCVHTIHENRWFPLWTSLKLHHRRIFTLTLSLRLRTSRFPYG